MGGYLLFDVEFLNKVERDKFEKQEKLKRMFQYIDGWCGCVYYPKWQGYNEPQDIIKRCKKNKIKINKFLSIDLSTNGCWFDEIKLEGYKGE